MRTDVVRAVVAGPPGDVALLQAAAADLRGAGRIGDLELAEDGAELAVRDVELAPAP
jgi:hypothetical protein